jgi:hypothetical protein
MAKSEFRFTEAESLAKNIAFHKSATGLSWREAYWDLATQYFPDKTPGELDSLIRSAALLQGQGGLFKAAWIPPGTPPQPEQSEEKKKIIALRMRGNELVSVKFRAKPEIRGQREFFHEPDLRPRRRGKRRRT